MGHRVLVGPYLSLVQVLSWFYFFRVRVVLVFHWLTWVRAGLIQFCPGCPGLLDGLFSPDCALVKTWFSPVYAK